MAKKIILCVLITFLWIAALILVLTYHPEASGKAIDSNNFSVNHSAVKEENKNITKDNFYQFISGNELIKNLPKDASLNLKLYNFNSGERQWEKTYSISKDKIIEGYDEKADADIILNSDYAISLANDFCGTLKKANKAGDLGLELKKGEAGLLWKYKSMMKYKSCFGF